jgi:hypothetical protein
MDALLFRGAPITVSWSSYDLRERRAVARWVASRRVSFKSSSAKGNMWQREVGDLTWPGVTRRPPVSPLACQCRWMCRSEACISSIFHCCASLSLVYRGRLIVCLWQGCPVAEIVQTTHGRQIKEVVGGWAGTEPSRGSVKLVQGRGPERGSYRRSATAAPCLTCGAKTPGYLRCLVRMRFPAGYYQCTRS